MSVLTPLRGIRRRASPPVTTVEWHVGLSHAGMFPEHEIGCPCVKAPCGLAVPAAARPCPTHHGGAPLRQAHPAHACHPRKWFHRDRGPRRA